jgi:hypothetical protein
MKSLKLLTLCASILAMQSSGMAAQTPGSEDRTSPGTICLTVKGDRLTELERIFKHNGAVLTRFPDNDDTCNNQRAFRVPIGLESWAIRYAKSVPLVSNVRPLRTTAGGSGIFKRRLPTGTLFTEKVTPENLFRVREDIACKLTTRLAPSFRSVQIIPKCGDRADNPFGRGTCYVFRLEGHSSDPTGFSSQNLHRLIDNGFWVSAKVGVEATYYEDYPDLAKRGPAERLDTYVVSSQFWRAPATSDPGKGTFREIQNYQLGVDADDLDDYISDQISGLFKSGPFVCDAKHANPQ